MLDIFETLVKQARDKVKSVLAAAAEAAPRSEAVGRMFLLP